MGGRRGTGGPRGVVAVTLGWRPRQFFQHLNRPADSMERDQLEECQSHYAKPFISSPRRRPSVRPSVRPPGKRRGELVGPSSLHRLSSNRPPASGGPLNERAASRLKKDEEDGER